MRKFLNGLKKIWPVLRWTMVALCGVFIMLWMIPPARNALISFEVFVGDALGYVISVVSIFTIMMLIEVSKDGKEMQQDIRTLEKTLKDGLDKMESSTIIARKGAHEVYEPLKKLLRETNDIGAKNNILTIAGLTLRNAWNNFNYWILNEARNWTITCYVSDPEFVKQHPETFLSAWERKARESIDAITEAVAKNSEGLKERNIKIRLITYAFVPSVHGFRINDTVTIAYTHIIDGKCNDPYDFYECLSGSDARSVFYKNLFDNHVENYERIGKEIISNYKKAPVEKLSR